MDYNVTNNDILADDILYSDKKDQPEVTIGEGMEFTIHGSCIFFLFFFLSNIDFDT